MDKTFNKLSIICMFVLPAFVVFSLIVMFSIVWVFIIGFTDWNGFSQMNFIGLKNYVDMFTADRNYWGIVTNTLVYTIYELFLQVGGGLLVAIFLTRITRGRAGLQTLYYIPVIVSTVALCQIFTMLLSVTPPGVVNSLLGLFNSDFLYEEWISNPTRSLAVAAFVEGYKYFGLYMVIFYAALIAVPKELTEAAIIDGASAFRQYAQVKLPYIMPVIISNFILVLNGSMRSFDVSFLLTKGGPGNSSQLLAPYMYKQAFSSMKYGYGSAVSMTIIILCVGIGLLLQKYLLGRAEEY